MSQPELLPNDQSLIIQDEQGREVVLSFEQLETIQELVSQGNELETIAVMLALDVDVFCHAADKSGGMLSKAVRRGYILDKQEFKNKFKNAVYASDKARDFQIYGENFHGLQKSGVNGSQGGQIIVINTGIETQIPWQSNT